jgi:hypothetical protein
VRLCKIFERAPSAIPTAASKKNSARILFFVAHIQSTNTRERARYPYFIAIIFTRAMLFEVTSASAVSGVHDASAHACEV